MALIECPECGAQISDRAPACPRCGVPLKAAAPPVPPVPSAAAPAVPKSQPVQGKVGLEATSLRCPYCGEMAQSKDILTSGWAHCPSCKKDFPVNGVNTMFSDEGMIEKIIPFGDTKEAFHRRVMEHMMKNAPEDFFSKVSDIQVTKKYIWVREFGYGTDRQIYPLSPYGETFFQTINQDNNIVTDLEVYNEWYPGSYMQEFNSAYTTGTEVVDRTYSAKEAKHRYTVSPNTRNFLAKDVYYCLPVFDETFTYEGETYHFMGIGSGTVDTFCWESMPAEKHLTSSPNFFTANVVLTTAIILVAIALLIAVIAAFSNGFWTGIGICILLAVVIGLLGAIVGTVLALPLIGLDKLIQVSINTSRRKKFVTRFREIQDRKVSEAKQYHNLDFEYTVPAYPLP